MTHYNCTKTTMTQLNNEIIFINNLYSNPSCAAPLRYMTIYRSRTQNKMVYKRLAMRTKWSVLYIYTENSVLTMHCVCVFIIANKHNIYHIQYYLRIAINQNFGRFRTAGYNTCMQLNLKLFDCKTECWRHTIITCKTYCLVSTRSFLT